MRCYVYMYSVIEKKKSYFINFFIPFINPSWATNVNKSLKLCFSLVPFPRDMASWKVVWT